MLKTRNERVDYMKASWRLVWRPMGRDQSVVASSMSFLLHRGNWGEYIPSSNVIHVLQAEAVSTMTRESLSIAFGIFRDAEGTRENGQTWICSLSCCVCVSFSTSIWVYFSRCIYIHTSSATFSALHPSRRRRRRKKEVFERHRETASKSKYGKRLFRVTGGRRQRWIMSRCKTQ